MNIMCSICRDSFTGADNETIYSTSCGHVFHYPCLLQWMERTQNCPHCRAKITKKNTFKLNLYFEGASGPRTGLEDYEQRNLQFELTMKNIELQQFKETSRIASEQSKGLRLQVRKLEDEVKLIKSRECNTLQENRNLKIQLATERQKNQSFGRTDYENVPFDVIDLDDSDPELLADIDANLQNIRRNVRNEAPEVIDLDDSRRENNDTNRPDVEELKSQVELKEVLLASAVARITELEKENLRWKRNGTVGDRNA